MKIPELNKIYGGDCVEVMKTWPDAFIHTCITSPPYWNLRDYGTATWEGGNKKCDHKQNRAAPKRADGIQVEGSPRGRDQFRGGNCKKCGAHRIDAQLGLEKTPQEYVANMVKVFREVRRVLRDDGTLWLNLGDSYASSSKGSGGGTPKQRTNKGAFYDIRKFDLKNCGLKAKDLCGIPWRVAFALQADGWYLRQDIIWNKLNSMPESMRDRCTKSHEYVFLLPKSDRYYFDNEAIKEEVCASSLARVAQNDGHPRWDGDRNRDSTQGPQTLDINKMVDPLGRNKRSVWSIPTGSCRDAHFAVFPEKLVESCVLAGTSEHGVCGACGAPWQRILEHEVMIKKNAPKKDAEAMGAFGRTRSGLRSMVQAPSSSTIGWEPSCRCKGAPISKAIVLDPFMGSGTVAKVALRAGRQFIGTDLNPTYIKIAEKRISVDLRQERMF